MLEAALVYASWGWHIHPLRPGDKRPLLTDWPRRATTEPAQIRRWWQRWPQANIGLACGPSGLLAIDLDVKNGVDGLAAWEALLAELGIDDAAMGGCTPASDTPSGGRHLLFSVEGCPRAPGNTASKLGPGIDTRGDGGYIVLPPSRLAAGQGPALAERSSAPAEQSSAAWAWRPEAHPRLCRPQPLPRALWQRLALSPEKLGRPAEAGPSTPASRSPAPAARPSQPAAPELPAYGRAALEAEVRRVAAAVPGERNNTLNLAAFSLGQLVGAGLLGRWQVERPLFLAAGVAGLGEEEATATARSGLDAGQKVPRILPAGVCAAGGPSPASPSGPAPGTPGPKPGASGPPGTPGPPADQRSAAARRPAADPHPAPARQPPAAHTSAAGQSSAGDGWWLSEGADDEGNAQCVVHLYAQRFLYCPAYGWMQYAGSHWARNHKGLALDRAIVDTLESRHRLALQAERMAIAKVTTRSSRRVRAAKELLPSLLYADVETFDASPDHLNAANGVLDLRTGELVPHQPGQRFTYCLEAPYDPGTDYRPWQDWLRATVAAAEGEGARPSSALPGEAEEFYLQLAVGYSLTGHTSEEVLFYLYGPPRSGKGTFTEALLALLGREPLAAEVPYDTFTRRRDYDSNSADLAQLKPCRLLVASEPGRDAWLNAPELKRLTGGNLIFAALKYREHFAYRPAYKIWVAGNHPPQGDVDDDALWSRLRVIPFPNSYVGREDRDLKARMKSPEMQRQILAWAADGARAWYRTLPRGLPTPPSIEEATQAARNEVDEVGHWLAECIVVTGAVDDFVPNAALHASYEAWRQQVGAPPRKMTWLTQALKAKGLPAGTPRWCGDRAQRGCCGIRLCE